MFNILKEIEKIDVSKKNIIKLFKENVKGVDVCLKKYKFNNSRNKPDIDGYEMKIYSNSITIGDFSADEYIFLKEGKRTCINTLNNWDHGIELTRNEFISSFGSSNKNNRFSWSGRSAPT